ncbi:MAG: hypothetical protein LBS98_01715 [Coriobacteriales bacterium]|jgi:hypothetical protein|nr:hypothetical protein [Coriobacteriales bacterium]
MGLKRRTDEDVETQARLSRKPFWCVEGDGGFTSVGVVVALLLVIALLFSSAQVYWINSSAGDVQFAADAGALAAENVVAEYYIVARIADAVVLSLSLLGLAVYGVAIVVSCIPGMQQLGITMMNFGSKVFKLRDDCAQQSKESLTHLQKALPFLSVANAAVTIGANSFSREGESCYTGFALLVPLEGDEVEYPDDEEVKQETDALEDQNRKTAELTDEAQEAKEQMQEAKLAGYKADCGDAPNYCQYERAGRLAGLSGMSNPYFSSVESWVFDNAYDRACAYYARRFAIESPANSTLVEQIRSHVRKQFYAYAKEEMAKGYARTSADGTLDAYFPLLAHNNVEIRQTRLYTDSVYPVDSEGHIHGVTGCPNYQAAGAAGYGSIKELEAGNYSSCDLCDLSINTIGRVASPSTSIDNGFEYHYRIVAAAAERYEKASKEYRDLTGQAKESAEESFDSFEEALEALKVPRFDPRPPGRNGCIALAFDISSHAVPWSLQSSFVGGDVQLPPRVALSAAALTRDAPSEGNNILASFLDRVKEEMGGSSVWASALGIFDGVFEIWGDVLLVYSEGADSLARGVGDFLRSIPLVNATPLASWAEEALQSSIEAAGLQGVDLAAPKPVLVNSIHVIRAGDSEALQLLGNAKEAYSSIPGDGTGGVEGVVDGIIVEVEQGGAVFLESEITIYTIRFSDIPGSPGIPIKVKLPSSVVEWGKNLLTQGLNQLRGLLGGGSPVRAWE